MNTIFVEGKADQIFVEQLLTCLDRGYPTTETIPTNGYAKLPLFKPKLQNVCDMGGSNIVIFDADDNVDLKNTLIDQIARNLEIDIPRFYFPNNIDEGCLEDLLQDCIAENHVNVMDCFDQYQHCIRSIGDYELPNKKARIYAYCEAVIGRDDKIKEEKRDYLDRNVWNLEAAAIVPLRQFLSRQIQST